MNANQRRIYDQHFIYFAGCFRWLVRCRHCGWSQSKLRRGVRNPLPATEALKGAAVRHIIEEHADELAKAARGTTGRQVMKRSPLRSDPAKTRAWQRRSRKPIAAMSKRWNRSRNFWSRQSKKCRTRDGNRCRRCGGTEFLSTAHVIPLAKRGTRNDPDLDLNQLGNLVTLCGFPGEDCHGLHDQRLEWRWADIGVEPDPELVRKYGYRERRSQPLEEETTE